MIPIPPTRQPPPIPNQQPPPIPNRQPPPIPNQQPPTIPDRRPPPIPVGTKRVLEEPVPEGKQQTAQHNQPNYPYGVMLLSDPEKQQKNQVKTKSFTEKRKEKEKKEKEKKEKKEVPKKMLRFFSMPEVGDNSNLNTNVVGLLIATHGLCPLNATFLLEGTNKRIISFKIFPCTINFIDRKGVDIIYGMFKNGIDRILPSLSDNNIYEKLHELRVELTHYLIPNAIRESYIKLNEYRAKYQALLNDPRIPDFKDEKIKLEQEIREMYTYIKYILKFPHLLLDINVYDEDNPEVPDKLLHTTDEFIRSQGGFDGTISAFKLSDTFSRSKRQIRSQKAALQLLGLPGDGRPINLLPKIRDTQYITIEGEMGHKTYDTTLEQISNYLFNVAGATILIELDVSCNSCTTSTGKPITKHDRVKTILEQMADSIDDRSNIPDEARYVEHLKHLLESQPDYSNLIQLLETMETDPIFTEILQPSKGGSQKIKNHKISKKTVKKKKGKKRRKTKRQKK